MLFSNFPAEIIIGISGHIEDQSDLAAFSRTCWYFHTLSEPSLYSKFVERAAGDQALLFRTISDRPELAKYVKTVELKEPNRDSSAEWGYQHGHPEYFKSFEPQLKKCLAFQRLLEGQVPGRRPLSAEVYSNQRRLTEMEWTSVAPVILTTLCHIEYLNITILSEYRHRFWEMLQLAGLAQFSDTQNVGESPYSLPRIQEILLAFQDPQIGRRFGTFYIGVLSTIPSLVTLSCEGLTDSGEYTETYLGAIPWPIKSLTLKMCDISDRSMSHLVRMCPNLERLHLGYLRYHAYSDTTPSSIFDSVLNLRGTLLSLTLIDEEDEWDNNVEPGSFSPPIPLITGLNKLKTLEFSSQILFNREMVLPKEYRYFVHDSNSDSESEPEPKNLFTLAHLPVSIVNLTIHNAYLHILGHFLSLDFFILPNLETIRVNFHDRLLPGKENCDFQSVLQRCSSQGVTFLVAQNGTVGSVRWQTPDV